MSWTLTKKLDAFAGLGEIKKRGVVLDPQVSPEEIKSREVELGLRVGLLLLQLFPSSGATDIVFVLAAVHGNLGLPGWRLFRVFIHLSPFSPSRIGHLASVDFKQNHSSFIQSFIRTPALG